MADPGMRVVGLLENGDQAFETQLDHGGDPYDVARAAKHLAVRPLDAVRDPDGTLVLTLLVRPMTRAHRPRLRRRGSDPGLVLEPGQQPAVRQRFAAYAVVVSSRGLLATEYSGRTAVEGRWGMPGGGLDQHEQPGAAVLREVAEETDQRIQLGELIRVQTSHWVGRSPRHVIEDFHAVRLIYRGTCDHPTDPVVLDHGGTTASALWVPLSDWTSVRWTVNWQHVLGELLPPPAGRNGSARSS